MTDELKELRSRIDRVNARILELLEERARLVKQVAKVKERRRIPTIDRQREDEMISALLHQSRGELSPAQIKNIFRHIFTISQQIIDETRIGRLGVHKNSAAAPTVVSVGNVYIGGGHPPVVMAGPCALESFEQASTLLDYFTQAVPAGRFIFRCGLDKPRTSPYSFQGLGKEGLEIVRRLKERYAFVVVSEITSPRHIEDFEGLIDMWQVGARNMSNFEMLSELGRTQAPILLKRSYGATVEELLLAAEYIFVQGNTNIVLCERGVRTFESWTRFTLDISAIPIIKNLSHLPVVVDVSHSTGRTDIANPVAAAALAAGADGIMVEVHPEPERALSDGFQQLSIEQFDRLKGVLFPAGDR